MGLFEDLRQISESVQTSFGKLQETQLNWKPSPEIWSIAQCLDHVIISNKTYFPTFVQLADGTKRQRKRERLPLLPSVWGNWLQRSMSADAKHKQAAPEVFQPSQTSLSSEIIDRFSEHQMVLKDLIERLDKLDHKEIIITSPANQMMTFSLKNACQLLIEHERRHLNQALKLTNQRDFPRNVKG